MQTYLYYVIHVLYSSIAAIYTASHAVVWLDDFSLTTSGWTQDKTGQVIHINIFMEITELGVQNEIQANFSKIIQRALLFT